MADKVRCVRDIVNRTEKRPENDIILGFRILNKNKNVKCRLKMSQIV